MANMAVQCLCSPNCPLAEGLDPAAELESCPCYMRLVEALQFYFGLSSFRPGQLEALLPVMHGRDCFVRLATGAGKSMCMFLGPLACASSGSCYVGVVISPLNALMDEQVQKLSAVGVKAVRVCSKSVEAYDSVVAGEYAFVLMSPETATLPPWRCVFSSREFRKRLALVAVDEAHCIAEWGANFRLAFRELGGLRALARVPIMALTASAPPHTEAFIVSSLELSQPVKVLGPLDRQNIYLSASKRNGISRDLAGFAAKMGECLAPQEFPKTLIFCSTKSMACQILMFFRRHSVRETFVNMYHASLSEETKVIYEHFASPLSPLRCLVPTVAFGMGLDIGDIQVILIYGLPKSLSQYYQQLGHAGRSGELQCQAHVFFTKRKQKSVRTGPWVKWSLKRKTVEGNFC